MHRNIHFTRTPPGMSAARVGGRNPHSPRPTSTLKIYYQNMNGWATNAQAHRISINQHNPDVILIAHTGLPDDNKLKFHIRKILKK